MTLTVDQESFHSCIRSPHQLNYVSNGESFEVQPWPSEEMRKYISTIKDSCYLIFHCRKGIIPLLNVVAAMFHCAKSNALAMESLHSFIDKLVMWVNAIVGAKCHSQSPIVGVLQWNSQMAFVRRSWDVSNGVTASPVLSPLYIYLDICVMTCISWESESRNWWWWPLHHLSCTVWRNDTQVKTFYTTSLPAAEAADQSRYTDSKHDNSVAKPGNVIPQVEHVPMNTISA